VNRMTAVDTFEACVLLGKQRQILNALFPSLAEGQANMELVVSLRSRVMSDEDGDIEFAQELFREEWDDLLFKTKSAEDFLVRVNVSNISMIYSVSICNRTPG
jgi:hypothetical protein